MRHTLRGIVALLFAVCIGPPVVTAAPPTDREPSTKQPFALVLPPPNAFSEPHEITLDWGETSPPIFTSLAPPPEPLTGRQKLHYFARNTFGIETFLGSTAAISIKQATDSVPEWGKGIEGYGALVASSLGRRLIKNTIHHSLGSLLHEDPRYYRSGRAGTWDRSAYAVLQTFFTHKDSGEPRVAFAYLAGTVSSSLLARQWNPEHEGSAEEYLYSLAASIGFDAAKNVFKEFWPDLNRCILGK